MRTMIAYSISCRILQLLTSHAIQQPVHVYHILVNFVIDVVLESNRQMISGRIRAAPFAANSEYG